VEEQMTIYSPRQRKFIAVLACAIWPSAAHAHTKWFAEYDLTQPPLPIGEVLTGQFVYLFLASVLAIYTFYWIDRYLYRKHILEKALGRYIISEPVAFDIMRAAAFVFFAAIGTYGFFGVAFFLTPELKTELRWVPWVQFGMALSALHRRTVPLIGLGIAILYVASVRQYGIFHLLDYLILLGVAYYFLASVMSGPRWLMYRYLVLYATLGLSLLWGPFEKWGYPYWTFPLLEHDPSLLMGLQPRTFMVLAGFVEFNLTFVMLSSVSSFLRAVVFGLFSLFALAIYKFGLIDAVGHLFFLAILIVLLGRGPTKGRDFLILEGKSIWTEAYFMTGLYVLAFVLIFIAYYGFHYLAYGN
jgi:hypothetical protein